MTDPLIPDGLIKVLQDGKKHRISKEAFDFYSDEQHVAGVENYLGEVWPFGISSGRNPIIFFKFDAKAAEYFAIQSPWINPREAGSIDSQKKRLILEWAKIGKGNHLIRMGENPFGMQSFVECQTDAELFENVRQFNPIGTALHIGDMCFIEQGQDQWLAIKGETAFKTIPLRAFIEREGLEKAHQLIDTLRAASETVIRNVDNGRGR